MRLPFQESEHTSETTIGNKRHTRACNLSLSRKNVDENEKANELFN